ncbi:MAG TPA: class I SAM-dependent methyltransferase [Methylomirabilota bacterium]|nr:class I SAM-dependent methyltransferase [Methylomirabilota bacterium]
MPLQSLVERLLAVGYGLSYDLVVRGFAPYQALLDEIAALAARSLPAGTAPAAARVLDVSCGTGTVAARLAADGYSVVGVDAVGHLVSVARDRLAHEPRLAFHHLDVARDPVPGAGTYDVLVSMHTLYWHPDPQGTLAACRRALRPGGHGIFLTYGRPARVGRTFHGVRAARGTRDALRALRWLVPTAMFETLRGVEPRYLSVDEFHAALGGAGFRVLEARETFLAGISRLAWTQAGPAPIEPSCGEHQAPIGRDHRTP